MPSSAASRTRPQVSGNVSLKNILGSTTGPVVSAWQQSNSTMGDGGDGGGGLANTAVVEEQGEVGGPVAGDASTALTTTTTTTTPQTKGRKERGKHKQTLFTIGSLAT